MFVKVYLEFGEIMILHFQFLSHWAIFHYCKWPNDEQIYLSSGHIATFLACCGQNRLSQFVTMTKTCFWGNSIWELFVLV